jgi:hypothetical protein
MRRVLSLSRWSAVDVPAHRKVFDTMTVRGRIEETL